MMRSRTVILAAALVVGAALPLPAGALDLGKTVSKTTSSLSKTVSKTTSGLSKTVSKTTSGLSRTVSGVSKSVGGTLSGTSVSVGSGPKGGIGVSAKSSLLGGTKVGVNALSKDGLAEVDAEVGGTSAHVGVLSSYQLASLGLSSDPSIPSGGGNGSNGGGSVTPGYVGALYASLDRLQKQALKLRCKDVLRSPQAFDAELILLCQILEEI